MNMMKNLTKTFTLAMAMLAAPFAAEAAGAGNIYAIFPLDQDGNVNPPTTATLVGGDVARFVVRLQKNAMGGNPIRLRHVGLGSEASDWASRRPKIGIYVSGEFRLAELESWGPLANGEGEICYTDFVFSYRVKPGDFELPMRLADKNRKMITDVSDSSEFYFDFLHDSKYAPAWVIDDSAEGGPAGTPANLWFTTAYGTFYDPGDGSYAYVENYDFTQCKYFIRTVGFDGNDETEDFWRTVHEGSTQTGGAQPSLHVDGLPTNSVTLYVWSMDESAVKVVGEKKPIHMSSPTAEPVEVQVATIKVVAGKTDYPFDIEGVAKGRTTQLVLSAFPDFQYGKQGTTEPVRMDDFTTVTVSCSDPLPASVKIAPALTRVTATAASWQSKVTELQVSFSEPFGEDVEVEIAPGFTKEGSPLPWADYIRFSEKDDDDVTLQPEPVANPKVLVPAGKKVPTQFVGGAAIVDGKIYVYALRADAFSDGSAAKLALAVKTDNAQAQKPSSEGGIDGWNDYQSTLTVVAQDPMILEPVEGKAYKAFADNPCTFQIKVSDDWANMTNAYKVSIWKDSTDGTGFTELADDYVPNPKTGILYKKGTSELPSAKYSLQTEPYDTAIKVKSVVSENESEERHVAVSVGAQKGYAIAIADEVSEFDEGTYTQLKITFDEMVSEDCYAFLKPVGEATNVVAECTWLAGDPEAEGQWIRAGETELVFDEFQIMDGDASKAGSSWKFDVVLLKTKAWSDDPEAAYGKFKAKNTVKYNVHNVTPTVTGITPDGKPAKRIKESGATIKGAWPKSDTLKHTFAITVDEPGVWDRTIDKDGKRFETVVTFYNEDEGDAEYYPEEAPDDGVIYGDPETNTCTRIFQSAGHYRCEVMLKDKDMKDYDDDRTFIFYFDVVDNPSITVETEPSYQETDVPEFGGSAKIAVKLAINDCTFPMYLKMKIAPNNDSANPGTFLLETNTTSCVWLGDGTYLVTIPKGKTEVVLPVQQMDGTRDSAITGFQITGELPEELNNASIVPGSDNKYPFDYYVWSDPEAFKVRNDPPVVETVSPASSTNVYKSAAGLADVTITWSVNDVTPDFERPVQGGVTVTFTGGAEKWETNVTSYADMIAVGETGYTPNFAGKSGRQTVMMTVKDHDGGTADSFSWEFEIESSKSLELSAHGPSTGFGGNNGDRYASRAKGIGAGRVWAKSDSEIAATFFNSTVNCGLAGTFTVYAYGYKAGDVDGGDERVLHYPNWKQQADGTWARDGGYYDGTGALPARDTPLNAGGNRFKAGDAPYAYAGRADAYGREVDSFLYAWLVFGNGGGQDAGDAASADELLDARIMPEQSATLDGGHRVTLPGEKDESGNYAKTLAEAVFAVEKFWSDNMGDINLDGIPDVYAKLYGFGVFDQTGTVAGDDLEDLAAFNDDEDYLPGTADSAYAAFIPGLASDWSAEGRKFGAALEIRGYGDHLNDATEIDEVVGVKPDRIYAWTDEEGNRIWSPSNCTLTELEFRSWVSAGCDPKWSPERPTDPTKADTDKDGLPDGYEYFFWYRAFVGDVEYFNAKETKGQFRRLTGHRYNPLYPETGDEISWQEIAEAFDPRSDKAPGGAMSPEQMAKRDFDNDGLPDLIEFELGTNPIEWDTDGDGLPDGWEVMHGYDPCKQKTDDETADGSANPDGDFMAVAAVPLTVIESFDDKSGRPKYFATTRALTENDVVCDAGSLTKGWRVKIGGATYVVVGEKGDDAEKAALFTSFLNAAPEPEPAEGGEEMVANGAGAGLVIGGGDESKPSAEGWYLAKDLTENDAFAAKALTEGDDTVLVRGAGARLFRGAKLDEEPVYLGGDAAPEGGYCVRTLAVSLSATGSAEDFTNRGFTAWRYGAKGLSLGDGKNHFFALGASAGVPKDMPVVGDIRADESVLILHHQVYQWRGFYLNPAEAQKYGTLTLRKDMGTGFNPTTGWMRDKTTGCVNKRWSGYSTGIFEPMQDCSGIRDMAGFGTAPYPGVAVDTQAFANRDEFLLMDFRFFAGQIAEAAMAPKANETMQHVWARETTLPVNAEDKFGADSDADGVPDGWELYVATGPSPDDSSLTVGTPTFSPLKASDVNTKVEFDWVTKQGWSTSMTLVSKFAGTDTMIAYADVPSVADPKNLFNERWLNKFWPLDPWSFDTDCDGIPDHQEGAVHTDDNAVTGYIYNGTEIAVHNGIYGTPVDNGSKCIPGGGMNPNSWDTDLDGLPDLWEGQHDLSTADLTHHGWYMDGKFQGGMDPTVHDSYTRDDVTEDGVVIDRDYDHDGLQNWQEYLTGVIRAFRYDDTLSPWTVPQWSEATGSDEMFLEMLKTGKRLDPLTEGGSNPHLVFGKFDYLAAYGSQCRRPSDYACGYWYFFPDGPNHVLRQGLANPADGCPYAKEIKAAGQSSKVVQTYGPAMYFTCSPTCADSDADGMDDYYELFHGMDPLYGGDNGRDLIAIRWANGYPFNNVTAKNNLWTFTLKARGTSDEAKLYDFAVYPWMAGDPAADPDGDDIRNVDEAIQANAQANETWLHTDPTPLWMTDSSDPNSLVSRYYGGIASSGDPDLKDQYPNAVPATAGDVELPYVAPVAGHRWGVENRWVLPKVQKRYGYAFVFEENDGYDTDHDGLSDAREAKALASAASDPQDSDDPVRRQAMYFPGARSALQAKSDAVLGLDGKSELFFLEFTVECWVKPEDISRAQTILERVIRHPNSNPGDQNLYRRNFQLGIDETGRFFAAYDSNGTGTDRVTARASEPAAVNAWAHLAATYDGEALVLYVNGAPAFTQRDKTHPATSAETIVTTTQDGLTTDIGKLASESAIVMGASIAPAAPFFSLVPGKSAWTNYDRFYKGYLDEVRVWDGARDGDSIAGDVRARKRYTGADLLANREAVFAAWSTGARRNLADGVVSTAGLGTLPPELVYHYTFDGLFGAIEESLVAQEPNGFSAPISAHGKAFAARPANWVSPGWRDLSVHSLAYHNYAYVPWIPNLVAHLPPFDGTTLDSIYWSEDYAGAESALSLGYDKLGFPRTREPEVSFVPVQQSLASFDPDATRRSVVGDGDKAFEFAKRARVLYATDLLPLGDAFVKYSTDFWDEAGASTVGDVNGKDDNFNNLPDWWEKLIAADGSGYTAEDGSSLAGVELAWNTPIVKDGVTRTVGEWYRYALAAGAHDTTTGGVLQDPLYAQTADVDKDGMPDWWEDFAGLHDGKTDLTAGGHAWDDADNDGLANISEYAVSTGAVLGVAVDLKSVGAAGRATDGYVIDYFRPAGDGRYLGEVQGIADHDMMEDAWEDLYDVTRANRWIWDALDDRDSDGWSNYAESRAGTDPTKVRHAGIENTIIADYPVPMIHVKVRMPEATSGATSIVFQAFSGSALGTPDATWTAGVGGGNATKDKILGTNPGGTRHYFLNPGSISPGTVHIIFNDQNAYTEYYTVVEGKQQFTRSVLTGSGWYTVVDDRQRGGSTIGDLVKYDGSVVGWVNYETGEMEVDYGCDALKEAAYVGTGTSGAGENAAEVQTRTVCDLTRAYVKFAWQAALVKQGAVSEFYLTDAEDGYVREGLNTFIAKSADGSLLGVARNVNVGWSKVEDLVIDLTETSPVFPRFEAGVTNGEPTTVRIVRKSINGVPSEKVVMRKRGVVGRHLFTEADFVKEGEFDLDWATLVPAAGVFAKDFTKVEYEVSVNGERLDTFTKTFESVRTKPVAFSATADQDNLLLSVSPTFRWTGPAGYTAFRIQVATNEVFTEDTIVYDSDARFLPALRDGTYEFAADCYLNEHLADGQTYFWHVAMMNAKFADAEDGWSQAATFTVAADSTRLNTGYGKAAVDVRYYGSNACTRADVVVGLYRSADFTDAPVALQHLADGDLAELAVTNVRGCVGFTTNSVALFDGLKPGTYYAMAFIDANTNGVRDAWESWGYFNNVGTGKTDLYTPMTIDVVANRTVRGECVLFMEDTDVNKDGIPDCWQDLSGWSSAPQSVEDADLDGDGLPDDWEDLMGDGAAGFPTDNAEADAAYAVAGDVMAYAEVDRVMVTFSDGTQALVMKDVKRPTVGDTAMSCNNGTYEAVYAYGDRIGLGLPTTVSNATLRITKVEDVKVVLVHSQVYAEFGYDMRTANADEFAKGTAVNTKEFTALDKYLVWTYLRAIGYTAETEETAANWAAFTLKPGDPDQNRDGIADGWQLYVMFNGAETAACTPWTDAGISETVTSDGDISWKQEFDGGRYPTDPWTVDTDRDGVIDLYAYQYHLKGDDAGKDFDGDGLSNYAEYLVNEVFHLAEPKLDPDKVCSSSGVNDYFRKVGDLYLGEIFTDHDQVDDVWEAQYPTAANRSVYDPELDADNDGWSNYAEFRAGTDPTTAAENGVGGYTKNEYPVPVIEAKVVYNGNDVNLGSIVFRAWNEETDPDMTSAPDAIWTIGNGKAAKSEGGKSGNAVAGSSETASTPVSYEKYLGKRSVGSRRLALGGGSVVPGSVAIKFFDGNYRRLSSSNETSVADAIWYVGATDRDGKLVDFRGNEIGTVDYATGLATFDCAKLTGKAIGLPNSTDAWSQKLIVETSTAGNTGGSFYDVLTLDDADELVVWQAVNVGFSVNGNYLLSDADAVSAAAKSHGHVREGKNTFVCYVAGENGDYVPGAPFGVVRGVDVGWQGAKFTVELSETKAVSPRIKLWEDASDRDAYIDEPTYGEYDGRNLANVSSNVVATSGTNVQPPASMGESVRVRVVRYAVDGFYTYSCGAKYRVVMDKIFAKSARDFLSEADFVGDGEFDIDWATLKDEVRDPLAGYNYAVTNMSYLVVIGNGPCGFSRYYATNESDRVTALKTVVTRRFEKVRSAPKAIGLKEGSILHGARPTFVWSMPNEEAYAKRFGSSYTAFRIQVVDADENKLVWTSDVMRAPAQDAEGRFVWTAPLYAGDQTANVMPTFKKAGNYQWRVAMYNAKYKPAASIAGDTWSNVAEFSTAVDTQQETDDNGYSSIDVSVKYTGPVLVLKDCEDVKTKAGMVRIQAFETADFSGEPVAQGFVADRVSLTNALDVTANGRLIGLPEGTYYVRAYIDSDGDFKKGDWESWGAAKGPVTVKRNQLAPIAGLFIEDADTDQDWLPDAWEYVKYGNLSTEGAKIDPEGRIVLKASTFAQVKGGTASVSKFLSGATLTFFESLGNAQLLLGLGEADVTSLAEIRAAVEKNIDPNTVRITAMTLDSESRRVLLTVGAKAVDSIAGLVLSPVYVIPTTTEVTIKVYRKESLVVKSWGDPVKTVKKTIESNLDAVVPVELGDIDFSSGFYKVEVVQ